MGDFLAPSARSALMSSVRSEGAAPEIALADALRARGLHPRTNARDLPGKPDLVFDDSRLTVFVDGDLWHGGQWRRRGLAMVEQQFEGAERRSYWVSKIHRNIRRDLRVTGDLLGSGWGVIRLWESEIARDPEDAALLIERALRREATPDSRASRLASASSCDFFAGIGLMSKGLAGAGWRTVWANDHSPMKLRLFLHNHREHPVTLDDRPIQKVGARSLPVVGLFAVCFPCTDLSLAGSQRGIEAGPESSAYFRFAEMLNQLGSRRPGFVILENVVGLLHSNKGADFRLCVEQLARAGYDLDAAVLDAKHFTPQSRRRLFVIATRRELNLGPFHASAQESASVVRPAELVRAIMDQPDMPWKMRPLPEPPPVRSDLASVLEDLDDDDPRWWPASRVEKFRAQVSERHLAMVRERIERDGIAIAPAFRRMRKGRSMAELRFDGLAGCLRTPKGGSAKQMLLVADASRWRVRLLTPRECARLMGVDDFRLDAEDISGDDALFGFGDAVVAPAVSWLMARTVNPVACEAIRGKYLRQP